MSASVFWQFVCERSIRAERTVAFWRAERERNVSEDEAFCLVQRWVELQPRMKSLQTKLPEYVEYLKSVNEPDKRARIQELLKTGDALDLILSEYQTALCTNCKRIADFHLSDVDSRSKEDVQAFVTTELQIRFLEPKVVEARENYETLLQHLSRDYPEFQSIGGGLAPSRLHKNPPSEKADGSPGETSGNATA